MYIAGLSAADKLTCWKSWERNLVRHGYYHLTTGPLGDAFDMEREHGPTVM